MTLTKIKSFIFLAIVLSFVSACDKPEQKEAKYLKRGNTLFEAEDYTHARLEYKNALRIMPTDAEPSYRLGLVDEAEGDAQNAFINFNTAIQQNSHYRPALLKIAQYYFVAGQYFQSKNRINEVIADAPDDPEAHALRAALLLRQQDFSGTEREARFALEKDSANFTAISVLVGLYSEKKDMTAAEDIIEKAIAKAPHNVSLLLLKAALNEKANNLPMVVEAFDAIFKLKPSEGKFRSELASTYVNAGRLDDAETVLRTGVAAIPDDEELKHDLIGFLAKYRSIPAAENEVNKLVGGNASNDAPYFWLTDIYLEHDLNDQAVSVLQTIITRDGVEYYGLLGRIYLARINYAKGDKATAEKLVREVLIKDPGNQDALLMRAEIESDSGNYRGAITDLRAIVRDNPKAKKALQLLSEIFLLQGHLDLATDTASQVTDIDPTNSMAEVRLAQMYDLNGNSKRAMELLSYVINSNPSYPVAWETIARISINNSDWLTATQAIMKLDGFNGQHLTATLLKAQVFVGQGQLESAVPLYLDVIHAESTSALAQSALVNMVEAFRKQKRLSDIIPLIKSIPQQSSLVKTYLGECLMESGNPTEASVALDAAISQNPPFQEPYLDRAKLYIASGDVGKALDLLDEAAKKEPSDVRAPMRQAQILSETGQNKEAISKYQQIWDNFQLDDAANNLAQLTADYEYEDFSALEKARQAAEGFTDSDNPFYLDTLAWVYYREGKLQQAEITSEHAMNLKDKPPAEAHYHYGVILLKMEKPKQAHEEFVKATQTDFPYEGLQDAKNLLLKQ